MSPGSSISLRGLACSEQTTVECMFRTDTHGLNSVTGGVLAAVRVGMVEARRRGTAICEVLLDRAGGAGRRFPRSPKLSWPHGRFNELLYKQISIT